VKMTTHPPPVARLGMHRSIFPLPQYVFMAGGLSNGCVFMVWYLFKHRDNFTFCLYRKYRPTGLTVTSLSHSKPQRWEQRRMMQQNLEVLQWSTEPSKCVPFYLI
jgi:hypothetical protein